MGALAYRKIIVFGDSSYVVSLPKDWVEKNGLKKGDVVNVDADTNQIKISPLLLKQTNNQKEINIQFDGNIKKLKSELIYAYINNYNLIDINGKDLFNYLPDIRGLTENLIALEIVQQSPQKIILKDFLNVNDVSVHDTLRRIDRIVMSMADDVKGHLAGKNSKVTEILEQKELDVNRLSNLIFKTLKKGFNTNDRAILKLDLDDIFYYWELTLFVEKVGDQLKRIPRYIKAGTMPELVDVFDNIMNQYITAMKANFTKDYDLALGILTKKVDFYNIADKCMAKLPVGSIPGVEKIKNINNFSGNIVKVLLKLRSQQEK